VNRAVFIVDIASCTGCYACSVACKDRAGLPDEFDLLRVEEHESGAYPNPGLYYRVAHCFHCADPPCAEVCPEDAISKQEDGLVIIDQEECIGCGKCIEACPFDAIIMLPEDVAAKCDGCGDEVARGWDPTCARACPMRALKYEQLGNAQTQNRITDPDFDDRDAGPAVLYLRRNIG
jgi:anaerobic dimethyl sulfoxide reductase subunit B (iron-sulfur subunit)